MSIQGEIWVLFEKLQKTQGTASVFIGHDLRVISHLAHTVVVLHRGNVVEQGPTSAVFRALKDAYTQKLLVAVI